LVKIQDTIQDTIAVPFKSTSTLSSNVFITALNSEENKIGVILNQFQLGDVLTLTYKLTDEFLDKKFKTSLVKCYVTNDESIVPLIGMETHNGCPD
jgi:Rieske Fe-S protein